jgi:hypothetical protein
LWLSSLQLFVLLVGAEALQAYEQLQTAQQRFGEDEPSAAVLTRKTAVDKGSSIMTAMLVMANQVRLWGWDRCMGWCLVQCCYCRKSVVAVPAT